MEYTAGQAWCNFAIDPDHIPSPPTGNPENELELATTSVTAEASVAGIASAAACFAIASCNYSFEVR